MKELLATPDAMRITTPVLPRETMERVLDIIRQDVAEDKVRVDNPDAEPGELLPRTWCRTREQAAAETSGANPAPGWPPTCAARRKSKPRRERILERLAAPQPAAPAVDTAPAPVETVDRQKLEALTKTGRAGRPGAGGSRPRRPRPASEEELAQGRREAGVAAGQKPQRVIARGHGSS